MTRTATITCSSVAETEQLAGSLASFAEPGQLVVLAGGLGAGKTTFVKAYAAALGVTAPVTSPTFTLVHLYGCAPGGAVETLVHADLWRLRNAAEVEDLGLGELLADGAVALVEWGDRFVLCADPVVVRFAVLSESARKLTVDLGDSGLPDEVLEGIGAR
jgi:tRNA threonylcarbamoyladenosine biosynthesis protein TsaE